MNGIELCKVTIRRRRRRRRRRHICVLSDSLLFPEDVTCTSVN